MRWRQRSARCWETCKPIWTAGNGLGGHAAKLFGLGKHAGSLFYAVSKGSADRLAGGELSSSVVAQAKDEEDLFIIPYRRHRRNHLDDLGINMAHLMLPWRVSVGSGQAFSRYESADYGPGLIGAQAPGRRAVM